jgi:thiol-disulfide isomerase/thioredoxin
MSRNTLNKIVFAFLLFMSSHMYAQEWMTPQDALASAVKSHKPVLVFIYQDGCEACREIAKRFTMEKFYPPILDMFERSRITVADAKAQFNMEVNKTPMVEGLPADDLEFTDYLLKATIASKYQVVGNSKE